VAAYQGIEFDYQEFLLGIRHIRDLASPYLTNESLLILSQYEVDVRSFKKWTKQGVIGISESTPIRTQLSRGAYRRGSQNEGTAVYGTLSCVWDVFNPRQNSNTFRLVGIASTCICIYVDGQQNPVARWQMETGDANSPGCHFHASLKQVAAAEVFPEWLEVPRLPGVLPTPMDCLEFLIGELFQDDWERTVAKPGESRNGWAQNQERRMHPLFKWQMEQVKKASSTPWMQLKRAKPGLDVFSS
jgi:hypothetical protein